MFAFVDGLSSVFQALSGRAETENWWVLLLEGLLGIAFGVIAFQAPGITALLLLLYIGFWAIATGALRIILAIRLRNEIEGEWWMVLAGLASILFGGAMIARPLAGALALLTLIGVWSLVSGAFLVLAAFRLKAVAGKLGALKERLTERPRRRSAAATPGQGNATTSSRAARTDVESSRVRIRPTPPPSNNGGCRAFDPQPYSKKEDQK